MAARIPMSEEPRKLVVEALNLDGTPCDKRLAEGSDIAPTGQMVVLETKGDMVQGEWIRPELGMKFRAWFPASEVEVQETTEH